ncbi:MAG TPA: patatin-like phospholipase family protein, partial [Pirellulales bacterium]|nr:patatin-like phospholipase family protein [Pirellulales bacterium]
MNENVSSGADQGLERNGAGQETAALLRTAATALLSAAEIWSTNTVVATRSEATATKSTVTTARVDTPAVAEVPEAKSPEQDTATRRLRPSEVLAEARFFSSHGKRENQVAAQAEVAPPLLPSEGSIDVEIARALEKRAAAALVQARAKDTAPQPRSWPPQKLSLALQGGGSFGAFTWGVLERLLEEPACEFDAISGASVGAVNAALLACGLAQGGREGAHKLLAKFWQRMTNETSFRSLMLVGGFSPAGSSVAFGPTLRSGHFDPFDLDPLREALAHDVDFSVLRTAACPKLQIAATRVRDGRQQVFDNAAMSADVLLASTCPPLVHCSVEIEGESYWDGGFGANPPLVRLLEDSTAPDVLVVQVTPSHDSFVPITMAAIDRRLDQIAANAALNAELAALEWAREVGTAVPRIHRIAAEDEIDGLAQRNPADLGRGFISLLHGRGRAAADRWLRKSAPAKPAVAAPVEAEARLELV